jgi:hypothetical protein
MSGIMSRTNSLLAASMVVLGLAVLARAAAIGQHAYPALLQPPMSGNDVGTATTAVATGEAKQLLSTIDTESSMPLVASEPEVSSENPVGEGAPAKPEVHRQMDSESQNKPTLTQTRRHRKGYNYRYSSGRLQAYWGPSVW